MNAGTQISGSPRHCRSAPRPAPAALREAAISLPSQQLKKPECRALLKSESSQNDADVH